MTTIAGVLSGPALEAARTILEQARTQIREAARNNQELEFKIRRYVYIRLSYDERGNPLERKRLKVRKYDEQNGLCGLCSKPLGKIAYSDLDRLRAALGYTAANTRLVHSACHHEQQRGKGYK
jgi:hypothetical protein